MEEKLSVPGKTRQSFAQQQTDCTKQGSQTNRTDPANLLNREDCKKSHWTTVLLWHIARYSKMEPTDAVKLLYQSEFGGGLCLPIRNRDEMPSPF